MTDFVTIKFKTVDQLRAIAAAAGLPLNKYQPGGKVNFSDLIPPSLKRIDAQAYNFQPWDGSSFLVRVEDLKRGLVPSGTNMGRIRFLNTSEFAASRFAGQLKLMIDQGFLEVDFEDEIQNDGIIRDNFVYDFRFDDGIGARVVDYEKGNHFLITGAPTWEVYGLEFDGANDYGLPYVRNFMFSKNMLDPFTIAVVFRPSDVLAADTTILNFSKRIGAAIHEGLRLAKKLDDIELRIADADGDHILTSWSGLVADDDVSVIITYGGGLDHTSFAIYINGQAVVSTNSVSATAPSNILSSNEPILALATCFDTDDVTPDLLFDGAISYLAPIKVELSAAQAKDLHNALRSRLAPGVTLPVAP